MEQIIEKIQTLFSDFSNFQFQIDLESKEIVNYDFDEINLSLFEATRDIENELQKLYLLGNDLTLNRVKDELKRIDSILKQADFGYNIHVEKQNFNVKIEPDISVSINNLKLDYIQKLIVFIETLLPPPQTETKTEQETIELKPVLKPEAVQIVFDIIKDFFSPEHQTELKQVIETGNKAGKKLLFKGNGNRLTDTFKKLIEHDFITGCQKQDLINWIISNFTFTQKNKVKAFVYDTVEKTISRNYYPCKSPLIEIKNGQIQRTEQPRTKKYQ